MVTPELALISGAARLIGKPVNDLYESAKATIGNIAKSWGHLADVESIYQSLYSISNVRTITCTDLIPLESFYYPSKVTLPRSEKVKEVGSLSDLPEANNILIMGTAGQGKSTFMRYLCVKELDKGEGIPIFAELRGVDEKIGLKELLINHLTFLGIKSVDENTLNFFLESGKFIFFLDGFDEVKREFAQKVHEALGAIAAGYPKTRWIVSTRPGSMGEHLTTLPNFISVKIAPLVPDDYDPFLMALGVSSEGRAVLLKAISESPTQIKNVLTTPLMLTLLNSTFGTAAYIPPTLHEFFENMFYVLVSRHDGTKTYFNRQKATKLTDQDLQIAFSAFCFAVKNDGHGVSLTDEQFSSCAKKSVKLSGVQFTPEGLKTDLLDTVCLMVKDGLKTAFLHKSIQEFFAAFFIKTLNDQVRVQRLYHFLRKSWPTWEQELNFLNQIDEIRYLQEFYVPAIEEFLGALNFDAAKKVKVTKKAFDDFLKQQDIYRVMDGDEMMKSLAARIGENTCNIITKRFFNSSAGKSNTYPLFTLRAKDMDLLSYEKSGSPRFQFINLGKYLRSHPLEKQQLYEKIIDFAERMDREKSRAKKMLEERSKNLEEALGF